MEALAARLEPGKTYCLLGSSGVGKTTLTNRLLGREAYAAGAVMIDYPFLDMVRMKEFGAGTSYIPEYGDPEIKDDFDVLVGYSPYHQIEPGRCYPPTLVQASSEDETSTPMHAYKYVAALQAAQSSDKPVLLQITWGAGHSAGTTAEQRARTNAEQLALLMQWVGLLSYGTLGAGAVSPRRIGSGVTNGVESTRPALPLQRRPWPRPS